MNSAESYNQELPPFETLFSDSYSLFKSKIKQYLILMALQFGVFALLGTTFIFLILMLAGGAGVFNLTNGSFADLDPQQMLGIIAPFVATGGVILILGLVLTVVLSITFQAALVLILGNESEEKSDIMTYLKQGLGFVLPTLGLGIVSSLLTTGGLFLLIIPGLLISIFLFFSYYELILEKQGIRASMKRSAAMVRSHFWPIIGRYAVLLGAMMLIGMLFGFVNFTAALNQNGYSGFSALMELVRFVFNFLAGFFSMCYGMTLYKQIKKTGVVAESKISWMWVTAAIGWLLGLLILGNTINYFIQNGSELFNSMPDDSMERMVDMEKQGVALPTQAAAIFATLNSERLELELNELEEDERLCAFARRRADQLMDAGGFDDNRGWYEDIASTEIQRAYLQGYDVISYFSTADNVSDASEIIENWNESGEDASLFSADHTNGCARSNDEVIVLVTAG